MYILKIIFTTYWKMPLRGKNVIGFVYSELLTLFQLISPVYLTALGTQTLSIITLIFAGHIGDGSTELGAVSLCQVFVDVTGYFLHFAIASALDTLASQAFGARRFRHLGVVLQRSVLIHLCISIPISIFWINMGNLLIVLHQSIEFVSLANQFMLVSIWINPAYALLIPCMKILQMQNIVLPSAVIVMLGNLVEGVLCYLLVYRAQGCRGNGNRIYPMGIPTGFFTGFPMGIPWVCNIFYMERQNNYIG